MNSIRHFTMKRSISSRIFNDFKWLLFLIPFLICNSSLSLAFQGSPLYITSNLPGATVYLDGNRIGETDERGGFHFDHIPAGTCKISIEKEGYPKAEKTIQIKGSGLTQTIHFDLRSKAKPEPESSWNPPSNPTDPKETSIPVSLPSMGPVSQIPGPPSAGLAIQIPGPVSKRIPRFEGIFENRVIILILFVLIGISLVIFVIKVKTNRRKRTLLIEDLEASDETLEFKAERPAVSRDRTSPKDTRLIGNYQIIEKIASGGMANIYKATHTRKGGVVALKIPYEQFQYDQKFVERFRREAEIGRKLHNENIIHIYESGVSNDGLAFIAMEYLDAMSLRQYLDEHGRMSVKEALNTIVPVCRALDYAHVKGVIHRDIKPGNIMLLRQKPMGRVVLTDFGIARAVYMETGGTKTRFLGTPYYMSPDQILCEEVDARSDIYSLGVVFFEMLAGQPLFNETDPLKLLYLHKESPPPSLVHLNPEVPHVIESIILKMLAKERGDRYQSVESLLVILQEYMLKEGIDIE